MNPVSPIEIPIQSRSLRLAGRMQLFQDGAALVAPLPAAAARMEGGGAVALAVGAVEVAAIGLALWSAVRELRGHERIGGRVDALNAFTAVVLFLEYGLSVSAGGKHFSPTLLAGMTALVLALAAGRLRERRARRRRLVIDDDGVALMRRRRRPRRVAWSELRAVRATSRELTLERADGGTLELPCGAG